MGNNKSIMNILRVMFSNITTIISGVAVGFLLPKVISLSDYGFFKTFTLYITYTGLFSLGIIDGIVLKYGSFDYSALDKSRFCSYFRWFSIILGAFSLIIISSALLFAKGDVLFVLLMVGLDMFVGNIINYFRYISQITQRFNEYSKRTVFQSIAKIVITLGIVVLYYSGIDVNYRLYLALIVLLDFLLVLSYIHTYKDIVFGASSKLLDTFPDITKLIKLGFPLMVGNLTMLIIMALDRQFVSILFPTEDYAIYAFAYNMLSLITTAISAISMVLYPMLKRTDTQELKGRYGTFISIILMLVLGTLLAFFPLCYILKWFLPKYVPSIEIFRIIFPGLAISSAITIVMHNYYMVFDNAVVFFKKSIIILIISTLANFIAYYFFRSMAAISVASVISLLIMYLYVENYLVKLCGYKPGKNLIYLVLMITGFYVVTGIDQGMIGMTIYLVIYVLMSLIFCKKMLSSIKNRNIFNN